MHKFQVGSSTMTILAMILPGLFTIYLEAGEKLEEEKLKSGRNTEGQNEIPSILR